MVDDRIKDDGRRVEWVGRGEGYGEADFGPRVRTGCLQFRVSAHKCPSSDVPVPLEIVDLSCSVLDWDTEHPRNRVVVKILHLLRRSRPPLRSSACFLLLILPP